MSATITNQLKGNTDVGVVEIFHFRDASYHQVFMDGNEINFYSDQHVYGAMASASMLRKLSKMAKVKEDDLHFYEYDLEDFHQKHKLQMSVNDYLDYSVIVNDFAKVGTPQPKDYGKGVEVFNDYL